jgi:uncharacterized membrane protein YqjE
MSLSKILGLMQTRIKKAIDLTEKGTITVFILLILIILLFTIVPLMILWEIVFKPKHRRI